VFEAGDPTALDTVFKRIDEMQAVRMEKVAGERVDAFEAWCLIALCVLGAHLVLQYSLRSTPW